MKKKKKTQKRKNEKRQSIYIWLIYFLLNPKFCLNMFHFQMFLRTLWKSSNCTPATAPRILDAIALQESPTKSGTENSFAASASVLSETSKCLRKMISVSLIYRSKLIRYEHSVGNSMSDVISHSPVIRQLQWQSCMVSGLHHNNIGTEIRAQEQTKGLDYVGFLGFPAR